jgi:hypothetical protein
VANLVVRMNIALDRAESAEAQLNECERKLRAHEETIGRLSHELRRIAEGNLGDESWQANYARIQQVARDALAAAPPGEYEQRVRREALESMYPVLCKRCATQQPVFEMEPGDWWHGERVRVELHGGHRCYAAAIRALASKDDASPVAK